MQCTLSVRRRTALGFVVALSTLGVIGGCASDPNAGLHSRAAIVIAVDVSVPGKAARAWQMTELGSVEKSASDAHYLLDVWSYGSRAVHLWGPTQPLADDQVEASIGNSLSPVAATAHRRADPAAVLRAIAAEPKLAGLQDVRVLLLTDGYADASSSPAVLAEAARPLASRRGWRIEVVGAAPRYAPAWQAALAPEMGARFDIVPAGTDKVLQENRDE